MPPIPIHRNDPINTNTTAAQKPDGVTPQTATQDLSNPPPTRTVPASVPATTTANASSQPPPPQPGARPLAPTAPPTPSNNYSSPAPPQPGYTATHHVTETRLAGPPPQHTIPPPNDSQLAGRSTVTSTQPSKPGPTYLNLGPAPPGPSPYQHEHHGGAVQELPRSSLEGPQGYVQAPDNSPYVAGGGGLGTRGVNGTGSEQGTDTSVGTAAWNILSKAGEALKKGEEAVWKAVRDK